MARTTNADPKYYRDNFEPVVRVRPRDWRLDALAFSYTELVNFISQTQQYMVVGDEQITTIAYRFYGTTSLWWVILLYNGINHPLDIEGGTLLLIPSKQEVLGFLNTQRKVTGAKVITI
jgi:nucleoid-associated protein YgaU